MKWLMLLILILIAVVLIAGAIAIVWLGVVVLVKREGPLFERIQRGQVAQSKLLLIPFVAWTLIFLLLLLVTLFVSAMCLMYAFGLFHGEWFAVLDSVPKTAGNVLVNLIYPLQMILLSMVTFILAVGGFQLVFGPVKALARFRLQMVGVADLAGRLSALIAIAAGLEVVKILFYGLLLEPQKLSSFFAQNTLPKADPLGMALLVGAILAAAAAIWKRNGDDR